MRHLQIEGGVTNLTAFESLEEAEKIEIRHTTDLASLAGLENLKVVSSLLDIRNNSGLLSVTGLEALSSAGEFVIHGNPNLLSLEELKHLQIAQTLQVLQNNLLPSLVGLENLEVVSLIRIEQNWALTSLSALQGLRTAETVYIRQQWRLASLDGLQGLTSIFQMEIEECGVLSLSGLEGIRSAGTLLLKSLPQLGSLVALGNLQVVHEQLFMERIAVDTLQGLGNLTTVGSLVLHINHQLRSLAALRLTSAWSVSVDHCDLSSLLGLGTLLRVGRLQLRRPRFGRMKFLGGPLAAGAQVDFISIVEEAWPWCVTPQERSVLVSALDVIFVSDHGTGCGSCAEARLQANVVQGVVDLSNMLRDEEAGLRSICGCGEQLGPVGQLLLRGPRPIGTTVCSRGHDCVLSFDGELDPMDRIVVMTSGCDGNPLQGYAASRSAENTYVLDDRAMWYSAPPANYWVCWRAPCSSGTDGPMCPAPENRYFQVGAVELLGPSPRDHILILGDLLAVPNFGLGVSDGDRMLLQANRSACGEKNEEGDGVLATNSTGLLFDFGRLTEDRVKAGPHHLCGCLKRDGNCDTVEQFRAKSGKVQVLCTEGQRFVRSEERCEPCPPGKERLEPGLGECAECNEGQFSRGGNGTCQGCEGGNVADRKGSSACVACPAWEVANAEATGCVFNPERGLTLTLFFISVGSLFALLVLSIGRQYYVVDVSSDGGHLFLTTLGPHGLLNYGRASFPVTLHSTGHLGLDSVSTPLQARVHDAARIELLTEAAVPIKDRMDTSMGMLAVAFPHDLLHQNRLVPPAFSLPALLGVAVMLLFLAGENMMWQALVGAAATALVCAAATAALYRWPKSTPLTQRLSKFEQKQRSLEAQAGCTFLRRCEKGPSRAIAIGKLQGLVDFFRDFIQDRTVYYVHSNIVYKLTKSEKVSFAELVGPGQVEWFVSHFWGTPVEHFCTSLQKHAESVCGERTWETVRYWICFCSNNQHRIQQELGATWAESSFFITLKSGLCHGTCMVLDDEALPLTRVWCIFELLQTVKLERNTNNFRGLYLCTEGGVMNEGSGSVEVAMALAEKVMCMDLERAKATNPQDAMMIREQVLADMGSYGALNHLVCREVHGMLESARHFSKQRFAAALRQLEAGFDLNELAL